MNQPAEKGISGANEKLDRLDGLEHSDDSGKDPKHTRLRAIRHRAGRRRFGEEAAVARATEMRRKNRALALETRNRAVNERLFQKNTDIVAQIARREIVRAVENQIVGFHDLHRCFGIEADIVEFDANIRVGFEKTLAGAVGFFSPDIGAAVEDLTLKV